MKKIAVVPSLVTLGNLLCGFGAIICASAEVSPIEAEVNFELAALLIFAAMVFDGLDGILARAAKVTSDFGEQLDSLCDVVSFGVAPAVLVHRMYTFRMSLGYEAPHLPVEAVWLFSAVFAVGAALRLARFNVETSPDPDAHEYFKGLPSPGAAGLVAGMIVMNSSFHGDYIVTLLPVAALVGGVLMVGNVRYVHVLSRILRGNKPFHYVVKLVFFLLVILRLNWRLTLGCSFVAYALTGPVGMIGDYIRSRRRPAADDACAPE